jgi:hypothetical protein
MLLVAGGYLAQVQAWGGAASNFLLVDAQSPGAAIEGGSAEGDKQRLRCPQQEQQEQQQLNSSMQRSW